jgi:hypothetical protein
MPSDLRHLKSTDLMDTCAAMETLEKPFAVYSSLFVAAEDVSSFWNYGNLQMITESSPMFATDRRQLLTGPRCKTYPMIEDQSSRER